MKRLSFLLTLTSLSLAIASGDSSKPSQVFRLAWVRLRVTDMEKSRHFYKDILELREFPTRCLSSEAACYWVNFTQKIELIPATNPEKTGPDGIGFFTSDVKRMRRYFQTRGLKPSATVRTQGGTQYFEVRDPEDHLVVLMDNPESGSYVFSPLSSDMIHSGFVVQDRAAEDRFYKDVLGFHVYWHGGMKDDETNWVDMQVPDGTDWIEYMLNVPANADHHTLGVMNHIALGVPDIKAAREQLIKNGWTGTEQPKIGRDGKWQLNLYDPDDTRVELMEFTPTQKPCCSEYTGPHPKP
jgi:catechol 2,3-dioxygenase-like lactoylglutathione lyase family enzyme